MEKIIHYCWFGGKPLSKLAKKCISSWKEHMPEYQIIEWNENNFDIHINAFCEQAYEQQKWAFVADVARCYALKEFGGLYFDTDMLVQKRLDHVLDCNFAAGWESEYNVAAGILWVKEPNNEIINTLWDYYENNPFDYDNVYSFSIPVLLTNALQSQYGLKYNFDTVQTLRDNVRIYPREYFYPIASDGSENLFTENTCTVHYYLGSWLPHDLMLRAKFKIKFGKKLGNFLLDFLVFIKRILRTIARPFSYPYRRIKYRRHIKHTIHRLITEFDNNAKKLKNKDYIVFYNKNWLGTSAATQELFDNTIGIDEVFFPEITEHIADYIVSHRYKLVIFSAFAVGWATIVEKLKKEHPEICIKVLWHGGLALNVEYYDWLMFKQLLSMHASDKIDVLGFVKKSQYEFFKGKGFRTEFVANRVSIPNAEKFRSKKPATSKPFKIGLYASGDRWVKNFYNQLAAASLFENATVNCIPLSEKTVILSKMFGINLTGSYVPVKREKMLSLLAGNDLNLYVTFTECAPLLPLESLELGVPCITGNNHHYWQGTPLEEYLVVQDTDNCIEIYNKAKLCLEHRDTVMELYRQWSVNNERISKESVKQFLQIPKRLPL